jgi:hypothetical protein
MMDERTFAALLDRHGADRKHWPAAQAREAELLLERSAAARTELERARALDGLLADLANASPFPARPARARIATALEAGIRRTDRWQRLGDWFTVALWRPIALAALPLALGFLAGVQHAPSVDAELMRALSELPLAGSFEEPDYDE